MIRTHTYRCRRVRRSQREALDDLFRHLTWLRNQAVEYCRKEYAEERPTPSRFDLYKWLTALRKNSPRDSQYPLKAQRSMLARVRGAYDKFFQEGKGRPRFKRSVDSFEIEGTVPRCIGKYYAVQIKGVGRLRFSDTRNVLSGGNTVKLVRIVRHPLGSGFDVQLVVEHAMSLVQTEDRDAVGIDVGVKVNCSLSNGAQYDRITLSDTKRKKCQRKVSRAKRGSNNRKKAKTALAKESRRIAVRRRNTCHRITTDIVKRHSAFVVVEDLKLKNMTARGGSRKRGLNRAMREQSLGMIAQQLAYKAESAGGELVKVQPHYTSQMCSECGNVDKEATKRNYSVYDCTSCDHVANRDINAARNIRQKGLDLFSRVGDPACRAKGGVIPPNVLPLPASSEAGKQNHDTGMYQ